MVENLLYRHKHSPTCIDQNGQKFTRSIHTPRAYRYWPTSTCFKVQTPNPVEVDVEVASSPAQFRPAQLRLCSGVAWQPESAVVQCSPVESSHENVGQPRLRYSIPSIFHDVRKFSALCLPRPPPRLPSLEEICDVNGDEHGRKILRAAAGSRSQPASHPARSSSSIQHFTPTGLTAAGCGRRLSARGPVVVHERTSRRRSSSISSSR
ncbi:hypothetical protein Mapa_003153 [Marchantia paleacea]|nr:hypothetical protein Mapa_003153 [Marchantia paleacea]